MSDRDLLELAAKAAGLSGKWDEDTQHFWISDGSRVGIPWLPLTDGNDALRLAVAVGLDVSISLADRKTYVYLAGMMPDELSEDHGEDAGAATCRAIVRGAAEAWSVFNA